MNALLTQQKQTRRSRLPLSQLIPGWVQVALFGWMICWGNHPPSAQCSYDPGVEYVAVGKARIDYSKSSPEQSDGRAERERASQTDFATAGYYFVYGGDGLLYYRQGPYKVQNISRDGVGRVIYSGQSMAGTTYLTENPRWNPDGTQSGNSITRNGATNNSDGRSYGYDLRSRLTSSSFGYPVGNTAVSAYQFDGGATGGLGLRTGINLSGLTGTNAASFGNFARLGSMSVSGSLTNNSVGTPVAQSYDAAGNVTTRTAGGSTDTLTWDAFGQLVRDVRTGTGAFTWSAVYDGLGRRLQTTQGSLTVQSSYDPEVEFLELVTTINGTRNWKVYGPDLDGRYGGFNGTGGLEAVYNQSTSTATYLLSDTYGHGEGVLNGTTFTWNPSQSDGYGALAGSSAATPINSSSVLGNLIGWRGHYIDPTGFYYLGARYYAPDSGTFLSPDPLGHSASMDLYSYCNGDPINNFDPDGRCLEAVGAITPQEGQNANYMIGKAENAPSFTAAASVYAGTLLSLADGNLNVAPQAPASVQQQFGPSPQYFSVNGINTTSGSASVMANNFGTALNLPNNSVVPLANPTHGILDYVRAAGQELGATDITSLWAADNLNASGGGVVQAHSNGAMTIFEAAPFMNSSARANTTVINLGPQIAYSATQAGFKNVYNVSNMGDPVALGLNNMGNFNSIIGSPFYANPISNHLYNNVYGSWMLQNAKSIINH